jgi:hypothetical protein
MVHYHIRWSSSKIDWQVFNTEQEAQIQAANLVRPGETYTIDKFGEECPQCRTGLISKRRSVEGSA